MASARSGGTATLLSSGEVLVAGGSQPDGVETRRIAEAELYSPASGTWTATGTMTVARDGHSATLLQSGEVLVAGGDGVFPSTAELYNPVTRIWTATGSMTKGPNGHTATLLPNGKVLVVGLVGDQFMGAELYDPTTGIWSATGNLTNGRFGHTATLLANGEVLIVGGGDYGNLAQASAEVYDPSTGLWGAAGSLAHQREGHSATLLANGEVLVAGGESDGGSYGPIILASAELFDPAPPAIISPLAAIATVGLAFSYQFEAQVATSLEVSDLPDGLVFDPALRAIIGNATEEGTSQIGLAASNSFGTTNGVLTIEVLPFPNSGLVIASVTSASGPTGGRFNFQVITSGGSAASRVTAAGLPPGLSIDAVTGEISGTATTDGSYLVTLSATEEGLTSAASLQLTFSPYFDIPLLPGPYSAVLYPGQDFLYFVGGPGGGSGSTTYATIGPLPLGLELDPMTGIIYGFPQFGLRATPSLLGRLIASVQLFACNSSECVSRPLLFQLSNGAANISTRLSVGTGDNVLIGGFITQGNAPMKLVARGIGPSLALNSVLANPYLELHNGALTLASNDNWKDSLAGGSQELAIQNTGLSPTNSLESAILTVLDPGAYTAIMKGTNNERGVGLVEVYNLGAASMDVSSEAHLANISTRGLVQAGTNVMIGGFINQGATPMKVLLRAIGPSLAQAGVNGLLANPVLELHQADGKVVTNDDWMAMQKADIMATGLAPTNELESAILVTLPVGEGAYTAIVRGANDTTGVGLVEAYFGDPCLGTSCP